MSERSNNYPTGSADGMSFIANRWVFTGPQGYRVIPNATLPLRFDVVSYAGSINSPIYGAQALSEADAHAMAERLSAKA